MAYTAGDTILASQFNNFLGTTSVTSGYGSTAAASLKVNALYGVGYADYGYGQTGINQSSVSVGSTITSTQWTNLRNMINNMRRHQSGTASLPSTSSLQTGDLIYAYDSTANAAPANFDIENTSGGEIFTANSNRANSNSYTYTSSGNNVRKNNGNWSGTITGGSVTFNWANGNNIRYFFNQGGRLTFDFDFISPLSTQDTWWDGFFSAVGRVYFGGSAGIPSSGSLSENSNRGYWTSTFTNTNTRVWDYFNYDASGTSPYDGVNDIWINARHTGTSANGGKGSSLIFDFNIRDQYTGSTDVVTGTSTRYVRIVPGYERNATGNLPIQYNPSSITTTNFT